MPLMFRIFFGLVTVSIAGFTAFGAIKLLNLEQSGLRMLRLGIVVKFAATLIGTCVSSLIVQAMIAQLPPGSLSLNGLGTLLILVLTLFSFAGFVFEVVALIWLFREGSRLPLIRD